MPLNASQEEAGPRFERRNYSILSRSIHIQRRNEVLAHWSKVHTQQGDPCHKGVPRDII